MTLRAYRPNEPHNPNGNEQDNWQDTLLDRPFNSGNSRQSALKVSYGSAPKSRIWLLTGIFAAAAILITGYFVIVGRSMGDSIPLIQADTTPYKSQPDQPGGAEIPFQDKLVFNRLDPNGKPVQAEKLLPPAEEPMQTNKAVTHSVTAPPATTTVTTSATTTVAPAPAAAPVTSVAAAPVGASADTPAPVATKTVTTTTVTAPATAQIAATPPLANPKTGTVASTVPAASTPVAAAEPVAAGAVAAEPATTAPEAKPAAVAAPKAAPAAAAPAATTAQAASGSVRIQLASIPDQANAQKALPTLASKYGSALGGAKLSLVKADIAGKGTYWRVQSQPLDKATADRACAAIKAQGGVCITAK